jgi:hypothetical protein
VTVRPNKKDPAHVNKWGAEKTKADEMEYLMWMVQDSMAKLREEQEIAKGEVRHSLPSVALFAIRYSPPISGSACGCSHSLCRSLSWCSRRAMKMAVLCMKRGGRNVHAHSCVRAVSCNQVHVTERAN